MGTQKFDPHREGLMLTVGEGKRNEAGQFIELDLKSDLARELEGKMEKYRAQITEYRRAGDTRKRNYAKAKYLILVHLLRGFEGKMDIIEALPYVLDCGDFDPIFFNRAWIMVQRRVHPED